MFTDWTIILLGCQHYRIFFFGRHKNLHSKCDKLKSLHSYSNYNGRFPFDISLCLFHKSRIFYNKHFTYFAYSFTFLLKMLRRKKTNHCWVFHTETSLNNCFTAVLCLVTQSCPTLWDPMNCRLSGSSVHGDSPDKNTGVGCHDLLQGIFPTPRIERSSPALQADSLPTELSSFTECTNN